MDKKKTKVTIAIPERGSLGILAYGYKSLVAWRQVVLKTKKQSDEKAKDLKQTYEK
jgi:hypothetical protein